MDGIVVLIALVVVFGVGFVYWKKQQKASGNSTEKAQGAGGPGEEDPPVPNKPK